MTWDQKAICIDQGARTPALSTLLGYTSNDLQDLDLSDVDLGTPAEQDAFVR